MRCLASTKVTIPSRCLQAIKVHQQLNDLRLRWKRKRGHEGTNHWICWDQHLAQIFESCDFCILPFAMPAKVQLLLHIIVRKEGLSLLLQRPRCNTFSNSWTYITKDLYHIISYYLFWIPPCLPPLPPVSKCLVPNHWSWICQSSRFNDHLTAERFQIPSVRMSSIFLRVANRLLENVWLKRKDSCLLRSNEALRMGILFWSMFMLREDFIMNRSLMVVEV